MRIILVLHDTSAFLCVLCRQYSYVTHCGKVNFVRQLSTLVASHKPFLINPVKESDTSAHAQRSVTEMHFTFIANRVTTSKNVLCYEFGNNDVAI
jgi:hypothetical protein